MINSIYLEGFKSFVSETIDLKKLTVLTGLNSSGKSTVVQALLLLEKAVKGEGIYLHGHGPLAESTNPFVKDGIHIVASLTNNETVEIHNHIVSLVPTRNFPEIIYIGADRFGPETSVTIDNNSNRIGRRGENLLKVINDYADESLPLPVIHPDSEGDTFLFNLRAWLNIVSPNSKFEAHLSEKSDSSYSTFNNYRSKNVGFGLSYLLPVITALLLGTVKQNSLVVIENPEAHVHPRGQTEMGRLICLCAQAGVQVIVETHSDHLFDGIRLHVKNNPGFDANINTYWFELDENKNTDVQQVILTTDGRVQNWPVGMFDQFSINSSKLL